MNRLDSHNVPQSNVEKTRVPTKYKYRGLEPLILQLNAMSPPIAPKVRTAPSSDLLNGHYHEPRRNSPLGRTSINAREREALTASIESSHNRRQPIDLNAREEPYTNGNGTHFTKLDEDPTKIDVAARDPRDEAPETSHASNRSDSPYTLNPPIDFDGLSWPSGLRYPVADLDHG